MPIQFPEWLPIKKKFGRQAPRRMQARPCLEPLEERRVPTVVFDPVFTPKVSLPAGAPASYTVLNSPQVYLIFWGPYWKPGIALHPPAQVLSAEAQAILAGPYLGGLTEYGSTGKASLAGAWVDSSATIPASFNAGVKGALPAIQSEVQKAIDNHEIAGPGNISDITQSPIYVVISDPNYAGTNGGYNWSNGTYKDAQNKKHPINLISVGTGTTNMAYWFGSTFSHEMAERMSDPTDGGVLFSYPTGYPTQFTNSGTQIADGEPEPTGQPHYVYQFNNTSGPDVQAYLSFATKDVNGSPGAFVVPDGNSESIYLTPIWSNVLFRRVYSFSGSYNLTITGDQLGTNYADQLTVDGTSGGTNIVLNGQSFFFPDYAGLNSIQSITVNLGGGKNTIKIQEVASDETVQINDAGPDNVLIGKNGSVQAILGTVSMSGVVKGPKAPPGPFSTLTIDDSQDGGFRSSVLNTTGLSGLTPGPAVIDYTKAILSGLYVNGSNGGNFMTVSDTPYGIPVYVDTGDGFSTVRVLATTGPLNIYNPLGIANIDVGSLQGTQSAIAGPIAISDLVGVAKQHSHLVVDDSGDTTGRIVTITSSSITSGGSASITFDDGVTSLEVFGGKGGNVPAGGNVFNVESTGPRINVAIDAGPGADLVNVGNSANQMDGILGPVNVWGGGNTALDINDQGSTVGHVYDLESGSITRAATTGPIIGPLVNYDRLVSRVNVYGGTGQGFFVVGATFSGTTYDLYGNGLPFDEFGFGTAPNNYLDGIQGPVHIHDAGDPLVGVDDFGATTSHIYNIDATGVSRLNLSQQSDMAPIIWDTTFVVEFSLATAYDLVTGPRLDQVNVLGELAGDSFNIEAGTGDTVTIGSQGSKLGGTVADIRGEIRILAGGESPNVIIDDSGEPFGKNPHFQDLFLGNGFDGNPIYEPGISGEGLPNIYFEGCSAASAVFLGGSGNNAFTVSNMTNGPALTLDGGVGGVNTLDFSQYAGDALIDLSLGVATSISGGIRDFANVDGSQGNDLIVGTANTTRLTGGTGRNVLISGGAGGSIDASMSGDDHILIAGTTDWDLNLPALEAIMAEWDRIDLAFGDRYNDLLAGSTTGQNQVNGQPILLNTTTVHADSAPTVLIGGTGSNWYLVALNDVLANFDSLKDLVTTVP